MAHSDQYFVPVYRWFPLLSPAPLQDLLLFLLSSSQTLSSELLHMSVKQQQLIQSFTLKQGEVWYRFYELRHAKKKCEEPICKQPKTSQNYHEYTCILYAFNNHLWVSMPRHRNSEMDLIEERFKPACAEVQSYQNLCLHIIFIWL